MSTSFDRAHAFTALWEGGLTDHPSDPGGITNHGVSLRWLKQLEKEAGVAPSAAAIAGIDLDQDGDIDADDIRLCTKAQAAQLFFRHFWQPLGCEALPPALACVLYDCAVNTGPAQSVKLFQHACNTVGEAHLATFAPLMEDGKCGPRTQNMAHMLAESGLAYYTARLVVRERKNFYTRLARQKPHFQPFLKGWHNRCDALATHLANMEREEL